MTTFGQLKTYIENKLIESYNTDSFKELNFFKTNILENNVISKIYNGYDELSQPKNLNPEVSNEYINESVILIQKLLQEENTTIKKNISSNVDINKYGNDYQDIDNLMYLKEQNQILKRIESKNKIKNVLEQSQGCRI